MMNYQEALSYLYNQLPVFSQIGYAAYKTGLDNIIALCTYLDNPQQKIKTIHIAGTNGKGSTSHMLASIFQTNGYKTGLLTSPHLMDFRERIRINGNKIQENEVLAFMQKIHAIMDIIKPSFFELTTAMAFDYFAHQKVDYAIIETGLGGALDSTNIITPEISIITNIAYDHQQFLGDSLQSIATAKAGIIKKQKPVFVGEVLPETKPIFLAQSQQQQAPIFFAEEMYNCTLKKCEKSINTWLVENKKTKNNFFCQSDMLGLYQAKNIALALSVCDFWVEKKILQSHLVQKGIRYTKEHTHLLGRWDILSFKPLIIADVAHNEQGIQKVFEQLKSISTQGRLYILFGMVKDKSPHNIFKYLPKQAMYYFSHVSNNIRARQAEEIQSIAQQYNLLGKSFTSIQEALQELNEILVEEDILLITGSIFLIGEAYQHFDKIFKKKIFNKKVFLL